MVRRAETGLMSATCFIRIALLFAAFCLISNSAVAEKGDRFSSRDEVSALIDKILTSDQRLPMPIQNVRDALSNHYVQGNGRLFWVGSPRMDQLVERLRNAANDGLFTRDYPIDYLVSLQDSLKAGDPFTEAYAELAFSSFFLRYASDLKIGRFVPRRVDPKLYVSRKKIDQVEIINKLNLYEDLPSFFKDWEPQSAEYRSLRTALRTYRAIVARGGWGGVEVGETLKPGMRGERVGQMRARLLASGEMTQIPDDPEFYDEGLEIAVRSFQRRHGLDADGAVGKQSMFALNVSAEERMRQIIVNMERWRWMPEDLGDKHILVNIAAFQLRRMEYGAMVEQIRVVVGKPAHATPVFSHKIKYVEINPTWTVPYSIATKELLPKLKSNPYALGPTYELLQKGQPVDFGAVDWSQLSR
ncbi:MAG: L,D-transpeptidase family protein, partial [Hyphomicrobiales bacterium]